LTVLVFRTEIVLTVLVFRTEIVLSTGKGTGRTHKRGSQKPTLATLKVVGRLLEVIIENEKNEQSHITSMAEKSFTKYMADPTQLKVLKSRMAEQLHNHLPTLVDALGDPSIPSSAMRSSSMLNLQVIILILYPL
jgi:hypothetical protein